MSIFEAVIVCILLYQLFATRALLSRNVERRESTLAFLRDSRKETEKMRSETRRDRAEDRQFYQQSREATLQYREENLRRNAEQVQRMEELLRLQREQVALLQQLTEQRGKDV